MISNGENDEYVALVRSVRFVGKKLTVTVEPPVLKIYKVTKTGKDDSREERVEEVSSSCVFEFETHSITIAEDNLSRTCIADVNTIVTLSERSSDKLEIERLIKNAPKKQPPD